MPGRGEPPPRDHRIGRIDFTVMPLAAAIDYVLEASDAVATGALGHPGLAVHFCNAYNVALAKSDPGYARLLAGADVVFSDGVPITWVGRRAYPDVADAWERVYGPDVMRGVLDRSTNDGPRHYLLGGSPETLELLQAQIAEDHPGALVVGAESPPFRPATASRARRARRPAPRLRRNHRVGGARHAAAGHRGSSARRRAAHHGDGRRRGVRLPRGHETPGAAVDAAQRTGVGVPAGQRTRAARAAVRVGELGVRGRGGAHAQGRPPRGATPASAG